MHLFFYIMHKACQYGIPKTLSNISIAIAVMRRDVMGFIKNQPRSGEI